jgi:hypothetical protein
MGNVRGFSVRNPRLIALVGAAAVALAVVVGVAAARSRPAGGCQAAAPIPNLPSQLRSIGSFDQPLQASDTRALQEAALRAASALHSDLAQTVVGDPVTVAAATPSAPDAVVIPLLTNPGPDGRFRTVEGLVGFLRACGDQAYYSDVVDLAAAPPPAFPQLTRDAAAARLGGDVALVWTESPFAPVWRRSDGSACVGATATPVAGCSVVLASPTPVA